MRKTKEIKRKRREASLEYRRGNRTEAYKMWKDAKKELDELRGRNKPQPAKAAEPSGAGESAADSAS